MLKEDLTGYVKIYQMLRIIFQMQPGRLSLLNDKSKDEEDEYNAYDEYFYGNNRSYKVVQDYEKHG